MADSKDLLSVLWSGADVLRGKEVLPNSDLPVPRGL